MAGYRVRVRVGPRVESSRHDDLLEALRELQAWIAGHLDEDLSVPVLAERALMSERSFARAFSREVGQTPGVYVEEIQTGPRPIEGVSTSTTGFVGETERGPTKPRLVTSWPDYTRWFGGYIDRPPFDRANHYLPYAVRGFRA